MVSSLIAHERQREYLSHIVSAGVLPHAFLFHGVKGVGKYTIAQHLAKALFCARAENDLARVCGVCPDCRRIENGTHSCVMLIDRDHTLVSKKEIRKEIPIDDIRELKRLFAFAPEGGRWRVAIINEVETMSEEAAHAFLKLLEEPGPRTLMILITADLGALLPTIISRTRVLAFWPVADATLRKILAARGKKGKEAEELLFLAGGRPGQLLTLMEDKDMLKEAERTLESLSAIAASGNIVATLRISETAAKDPRQQERVCDWAIRLLRTRLLKGDFAAVEPLRRVSRIASIMETTNVNPRLAMDTMMLEFVGPR